jgi:hypothetical protein
MPAPNLSARPKLDRLAAGSGLAAPDGTPAVDPNGGDQKAGLIRGVAVISRGPALGHGMFIDAATLQQAADLINAGPNGSKSRFTHPSLSGDGTGKLLGRVKNASVDGDVTRGDLHMTPTAHKTPDGDLAGYVMGLAQDDPEAFGNSIAFEHDIEAENLFVEQHGGKVLDAEYGVYDLSGFASPDPDNEENTFHVRLKELRAVDVVDEPAANASGLFHRGQEIPAEADALCAYAFGLCDTRPASASFGIDPDRLRGFAGRFLSSRGLALAAKEAAVPKPETRLSEETEAGGEQAAETQETAETTEGGQGTEEAAGQTKETPKDDKAEALAAARAEVSRFFALNPAKAQEWLDKGVSYEDAQAETIAALKADTDALSKRLGSLNRGEKSPVSFSAADAPDGATPQRTLTASEGVAQFAASLRLPSRN